MMREMKPLVALALVAVLGFAVVGCGATKKIVVDVNTNSLALKAGNEYTGAIPGIALDHRIGLVSFREPKSQITKALGRGVAVRIHGQPWRFYPKTSLYVAYPHPSKGKQTYAAFIMTRSTTYETRLGVGVGSSLRQLRGRVKVTCYNGTPVSPPTECQHEKANINLPFTVFEIDPTTRRVTSVAIVPGGD
jgi:hypothetical protein